ncbi:class I SAM-dependent methyltransferase [Williamsia sterculiae]|nr:methyltransferase domain-containing protein [Williamsia sterculiae]
MQNPMFAGFYERAWRPAFTRLFSLGGEATADVDRELVEHLGRPGERRILDVACGPGNYTARLGERLTGDGCCIGLDFSAPMLRQAVADNSGERVAYVRGDAHRLPFPDDSFDAVVCLAALYLIPDPKVVIAELMRVLQPGGEIAVFTTVRTRLSGLPGVQSVVGLTGLHIFGRHEITRQLQRAGIADVEQTITGQAQYVRAYKPRRGRDQKPR